VVSAGALSCRAQTHVARFRYGWFGPIASAAVSVGRSASPNSNTFEMSRETAPRYASPISYRKMKRRDSESVRTSSFVRKPSRFLSCRLKNHSMLSISPPNMMPSSPDTMSWNESAPRQSTSQK
jgi:hypothetical protein